ncbi:MAG: hypothetical protein ACM3QX_18340 [Syntrophomonadaceae bacterium]
MAQIPYTTVKKSANGQNWIVSNRPLQSNEISDLLETIIESDETCSGEIQLYCSNETWKEALSWTFGNSSLDTFIDTVRTLENKHRIIKL